MEKLFHPENPVIIFLGRVCDLMLLSVLFTLSCSTIVLAGAAVTALYSMTLKMERGEEGETAKGFFRALFGSFLQSVPGSVLLFLDTALLMLMRSSPSGDISAFLSYAFALLSIAAILLTAWLGWLFPLQARFENSFRRHSKNAAILALSNLPVTCLLTLINLLPFISLLIFPGSLGELIAFWVIFGFGGVAYVNSFYLRRTFDRSETI